jgi:hypothetical protein
MQMLKIDSSNEGSVWIAVRCADCSGVDGCPDGLDPPPPPPPPPPRGGGGGTTKKAKK